MNFISRIGTAGAALVTLTAGVAAPGIAEAKADGCKDSISLTTVKHSRTNNPDVPSRLSTTVNWNQCWSGTTFIQMWVYHGKESLGGDHIGPGSPKAGHHSKKMNFDGRCTSGKLYIWAGLYKNNTDIGKTKAETKSNTVEVTC